jgi:hypothetical protein
MKCPKCGYISFDYNLSCPKCNKDISSEQEKLHIPAFRPDPPFLLGALTGEANESQVGVSPTGSQASFEKAADISLDDSDPLDSGEVSAEDSSELNMDAGELSLDDTSSLSLDTGEVQAQVAKGLQRPKTVKDKAGSGEFKLEPEEDLGDLDLGEEGEEELSLDTAEKVEETAPTKETTDSEMDITLDLEEDELAESESSNQDLLTPVAAETTAPELEPLDLEAEEGQGKEEIELSLDDLKINDTGELELGTESKASGELDGILEMDELKLDEIPLTEVPSKSKREARVVNAAAPKKKAEESADDELSLDLDDLELDLEMEDAKPQR